MLGKTRESERNKNEKKGAACAVCLSWSVDVSSRAVPRKERGTGDEWAAVRRRLETAHLHKLQISVTDQSASACCMILM